jgi:hypothetical protein
MVTVKWALKGGGLRIDAAEKAVGKVLTFYQEALAGITCPTHGQEPGLKVEGRTVRDLVVSIETCCGELLEKANTRVNGLSRRSEELG